MSHLKPKHIFTVFALLFCFTQSAKGQYLETFSVPNKGYLLNLNDDLAGVNWTLTAWPTAGGERDATDYFNTTVAGQLECIDLDAEVSWVSPELDISTAGAVIINVPLVWNGFDTDIAAGTCAGDYIRVSYSVNGGAFVMVTNQFGGNTCATVAYPFGSTPPAVGTGTVTIGGITGNTLKIRVSVFTNANAELVQIDNVSVPKAGVSLFCVRPTLTTAVTNVGCGSNTGAINLTATGGVSPYTYDWADVAGTSNTQDRTGLAPGTYTVIVTDNASCPATTSATVLNAPFIVSAIVSPTSCSTTKTGTIDVTASGGTTGYTYNWADIAGTIDAEDRSGLAAGSYSVTATDAAGCTATANPSIVVATTGAYLETFSIPERGYLLNNVNNLLSVNWSLGPWPLDVVNIPGRDLGDYFKTTAAGKLEVTDTDQPIYWQSPELNITGLPSVQFSVDLTWLDFDADAAVAGDGDYIAVQYSINGGAYVEIPNVYGGGLRTINYPIGSGIDRPLLSGVITKTGLTGYTLQIRVIVNENSQNEIVTIDNVSVPQTVGFCVAPVLNATSVNVLCKGTATGSIDLTVTGAIPPYTYDWADVAGTTNTQDRAGLLPGGYTVIVSDAATPAHTTTATYNVTEPATVLSATTSQTPTACSGGNTGSATVTPAGGTGAYTYVWTPSGGSGATASSLAAGPYTCTIKDANLCQVAKLFTIIQLTIQLPSANTNTTVVISPSNMVVYDANCNLLTTLVPVGTTNALGGNVLTKVVFDGTVQSFGGRPYVQRHYDIEPATNAANATATVTLYFTQAEFNSFNLARGIYPALPTGSSDGLGITNLKVNQFHGTGTIPGNYTGASVLIDPVDGSVVWNNTAMRWEISFSVTGFSGFYITTGATPLPLTLVDFKAALQFKKAVLQWTTSNEVNTAYTELERSLDARSFSAIYKATAAGGSGTHHYQYTDHLAAINVQPYVWYRLKMVDKDGNFRYSSVVSVSLKNSKPIVTVSPNPFKGQVLVNIIAAEEEQAFLRITDLNGKTVFQQNIVVRPGQNTITLKQLNGFASGAYLLHVSSNHIKQTVKLIK